MRVLAGKYKFKKINVAKDIKFSPISSFLKSNIFNILQNKIDFNNLVVVDLFAGTGNLGLETLSRGAKYVFFNDINNLNCKRIKELLDSLKDKKSEVNNLNYLQFLVKLKQLNKKVDLIFVDPPYKEYKMLFTSLQILNDEDILNENGFIVFTSPLKKTFEKFDKLELFLEKKYGKNFIYFLKYKKNKTLTIQDELKDSKILIISGPSGVGKKQIIKNLINDKDLNLAFSISTTTRKIRHNEINGKDYEFITESEFEKKIKSNDFIEYAKFVDNYYGTSKEKIKELVNKNKNILLEIEIIGALNIKKQIPNAIWIFIFPPTIQELEKRLKKRGTESKEELEKRLKKALKELNFISSNNECDLLVFNNTIDKATKEIRNYLKKIIK